ncbi:hypothetical protein NMD1_01990 [Novosphingobium sp. MD-1]|nr:hypothetical protein NMD1_01990 [Novosphingobium sp. MD-1]
MRYIEVPEKSAQSGDLRRQAEFHRIFRKGGGKLEDVGRQAEDLVGQKA